LNSTQTEKVDRLVAADREQPLGQTAFKLLRRLLAQPQEGVLDRVGRRLPIAQKPHGKARQPALELFERRQHPASSV
jgi:hypothetical protein